MNDWITKYNTLQAIQPLIADIKTGRVRPSAVLYEIPQLSKEEQRKWLLYLRWSTMRSEGSMLITSLIEAAQYSQLEKAAHPQVDLQFHLGNVKDIHPASEDGLTASAVLQGANTEVAQDPARG